MCRSSLDQVQVHGGDHPLRGHVAVPRDARECERASLQLKWEKTPKQHILLAWCSLVNL